MRSDRLDRLDRLDVPLSLCPSDPLTLCPSVKHPSSFPPAMASPVPSNQDGPDPILVSDQVVRRFGSRPVVNGVSIQVSPGTIHLVVGANGSGKATLSRLFVGLLRPHRGQVRVFGGDPRIDGDLRRRIGYLGHESQLYGDLSAVENLRFAA